MPLPKVTGDEKGVISEQPLRCFLDQSTEATGEPCRAREGTIFMVMLALGCGRLRPIKRSGCLRMPVMPGITGVPSSCRPCWPALTSVSSQCGLAREAR